MGVLLSCCRRQKDHSEREPLLPKDRPEPEAPRYNEAFADVVAAINAGKLPSQTQLDHAARLALNSDLLNVEDSSGPGTLSDNWRKIVGDVREIIEATVEIGLQKNGDNLLQEIIFLSKDISLESAHTEVAVDVSGGSDNQTENLESAASNIPSSQDFQTDTKELAGSVSKLVTLIFTSSAFRVLLQDFFVSTREIIASAAATVGKTAGQVQVAAEKISDMVDPATDSEPTEQKISAAIRGVGEESADIFVDLKDETRDKARDLAIDRIQRVIGQAQSSPEYKKAIQTIIQILRKYHERLDDVATAAKKDLDNADDVEVHIKPQLWTDDNLSIVLADAKILLERFASNHSLDPMIKIFKSFMDDMAASLFDPDLKKYFSDLGKWFDRALGDPEYAISPEGRHDAEALYDRGRVLTKEDTKFGKDIRVFFDEVDSFTEDFKRDRTSQKLFNSMDSLSQNLTTLYKDQPGQLYKEFRRDAMDWFLPRLLRTLRSIPMPRIEFINDTLEVALDALILNTSSTTNTLMPDHIRFANWNELVVNAGKETVRRNRARVHVDGLRFSIKDLAYYMRYKGFLGYEDQGLLSIYAGEKPGQGLAFVIDVEIDVDSVEDDTKVYFKTKDVRTSVKGLRFSINQSDHWILNKMFVQPFAGPVVRKVFENVAAQYIRMGLDTAARFAKDVQRDVRKHVPEVATPTLNDYWSAILRQSSSGDEPPPQTVHTETTMKGIIRTTHEDTDSSMLNTPPETTIAVGIGPQILPDKGLVGAGETTAQVARDALDEVDDVVRDVRGKTREVVEGVEEQAQGLTDDTTRRFEQRKKAEKKTGGWRSSAFDLW